MRPLLEILPAVLQRTVQDPSLVVEITRKATAPLTNRRHQRRTSIYRKQILPPSEAIAEVLKVDIAKVTEAMDAWSRTAASQQMATKKLPSAHHPIRSAAFLELCYAIVRLVRPSTTVETGVASGYSSAAILEALQENGTGILHSIDLPAFRPGTSSMTGQAVPQRLRSSRWDLRLGPDRRLLPELLSQLGAVDLFFYDSDKSYAGMMGSWELVWPRVRRGGLLVLDDIHLNDALLDFCEYKHVQPLVTFKPRPPEDLSNGPLLVGLLQKTNDTIPPNPI